MNTLRFLSYVVFYLVIMAGASGCATDQGLQDVMRGYNFTPVSPPQTNWEDGSVVEIARNADTAPVLRVAPSQVNPPVSVLTSRSDAPDVSRTSNTKTDIHVGISLPHDSKVDVALNGARQYSVEVKGNFIQRMPLDPYIGHTDAQGNNSGAFRKIADQFAGNWVIPIQQGTLFYLYELWYATDLVYTFYDEGGAQVKFNVPIKVAPIDVSLGWSSTADGKLVFHGSPICIGYKSRPIHLGAGGPQIEAMELKNLTAAEREAHVDLQMPRPLLHGTTLPSSNP